MTDKDTVMMIETNIDDMNPQYYDHVIDLLLDNGALDAYLTPVIMKKGRPGVKLSALSPQALVDEISDVILRETTSIGLRMYPVERLKLERVITDVETGYGTIRIKVVRMESDIRYTPEYDDCLEAARNHDIPISKINDAVRAVADKLDLDGLF